MDTRFYIPGPSCSLMFLPSALRRRWLLYDVRTDPLLHVTSRNRCLSMSFFLFASIAVLR